MKKYNVGILGGTGAVGREMIKILEEHNFPVGELCPLASARSAGTTVPFHGKDIVVREIDDNAFDGLDLVLGAAPNKIAVQYAPAIVKAGALFVDNSSAFRMDPAIPLVVPEINPGDAVGKKCGIISNPNCSTIITLVAVAALNKISPIQTMVASTYQAVSGAGAGGPIELAEQIDALANGGQVTNKIFPYQIAENLIPQIGEFKENLYTAEEMKMQNEGRKIMHLPNLRVSCTCVRVPIVRSHSISVTLVTERKITVEEAKVALATAPGVRLYDTPEKKEYPMPLVTSDQDLVYVGRVREDLTSDRGLTLFCCGDQIRKGAATNAVQIAEIALGI